MECQCDYCRKGCTKRPGTFKFGELEKAAALKGMSPKEFFDKYCIVDFWIGGDTTDEMEGRSVFYLMPAREGTTPGQIAPFSPHGTCVFYKNGLCDIHAAKPSECAFVDCQKTMTEMREHRIELIREWRDHGQDQIVDLLGHEPEVPDGNIFDAFGMMLGEY